MNKNNLQDTIKGAFEYKQAGNFKNAIQYLYKALEFDPDSAEVLSEIAGLYSELNNYDKAVRYYEQALLSSPDNNDIKFKLALVYKKIDLISKALPLLISICEKDKNVIYLAELLNLLYLESRFEEVIEYFEKFDLARLKNSGIYYYTGASYLALNNIPKALELYKAAVSFDNSDYDITYNCANLLYEQGQYKEAANILLSNTYAKTNHKTFYLLGEICVAQEDFNKAVEYYSKAIKLNPKNPLYYYSLATSYSVNGFLKEAEENYHNAVKLSPNNLFYSYTLAFIYYQTKQISKAKEKIKNILSINPDNINALTLKARIATDENDVVSAEQIINKVLKADPNNDYALYIRSEIYKKLSWWDKAIETINHALKINPYSLEYLSEAVTYNIAANKLSNAENLCFKIIELDNKYIFAYTALTEIYVKQKRYSEALEYIDKTLELDLNTDSAYIMKATIYKNNKLYDETIEAVKNAISLAPDKIDYYLFAADLYYLNKKYKDALKYYKEAVLNDASSVYAKYRSALCSQALGDYKEAVSYYSLASRLNPSNTDISLDYAECLCRMKRYKSALSVLNKAIVYADNPEKSKRIMDKTEYIKSQITEQLFGIQKLINKFKKQNKMIQKNQ